MPALPHCRGNLLGPCVCLAPSSISYMSSTSSKGRPSCWTGALCTTAVLFGAGLLHPRSQLALSAYLAVPVFSSDQWELQSWRHRGGDLGLQAL